MANVATLSARAAFDVSSFQSGTQKMLSGLAQIRGALKETNSQVNSTQQSTDKMGDVLGGVGKYFTAGAIAGGSFAVAMKAVDLAVSGVSYSLRKLVDGIRFGAELTMQAERSQMAFEVMLGSVGKAQKMMSDIQNFAMVTPLSVQGVNDNVKLLMGMGVATDDLIPAMKTLGDLALGNQERFGGIALAYGQVMSKGKLMGQEFNQLAERGVNLRQVIADQMGIAVEDFAKTMEEGKITADIFRNGLITLAETKFANAITRDAETMGGKLDMLAEKSAVFWKTIAGDIGDKMPLQSALDAANELLNVLTFYSPVIAELGRQLTQALVVPLNASLSTLNAMVDLAASPITMQKNIAQGKNPFSNIFSKPIDILGDTQRAMELAGNVARGRDNGAIPIGMQKSNFSEIGKQIKDGIAAMGKEDVEERGLAKSWMIKPFSEAIMSATLAARRVLGDGFAGVSNANNMIQGLSLPQQQNTQYQPNAALQVGSSEAFSAIIRNMVGRDKKQDVEQMQLKTLQTMAKDIAKFTEKLLSEGVTTLTKIEDFAVGGA